MKDFLSRSDGFLQWDTGSLTFLIGSTDEDIPHMALWVTTISTLNYRMIERKRIFGNLDNIIKELIREARKLHVKSRVIGGSDFIDYINKRQEVMDSIMYRESNQKMIII